MLKFAMPKGELQTGKFEAAEGAAAGAQAGVVDAGEISTLSALILQEQRLAAAAQAELERNRRPGSRGSRGSNHGSRPGSRPGSVVGARNAPAPASEAIEMTAASGGSDRWEQGGIVD
uniref:Uncharacterized protein n=2 Tax=Emiliania huxleyi TaxID=2903 RepID=A0A7S3T8M4_EMIHU|mmetsp:Transcript_35351/g.104829  ORF Transcript_35351/g.104829 Transcript_35351/m.104829 type:complete len:118 (-) Transcript_35351:144-497(-)